MLKLLSVGQVVVAVLAVIMATLPTFAGEIILLILLIAFLLSQFVCYRAISKAKVEHYKQKLKIISVEHVIPKIVLGTKERYYS